MRFWRWLIVGSLVTGVSYGFLGGRSPALLWYRWYPGQIAPLVMEGGDPYIRALMRTISASEANDPSPYTLLYGGDHVHDLSRHPDRCIPIRRGPNQHLCTTAAGRYQFLSSTWAEKAAHYHPNPPGWFWSQYSFAPEYQDQVVYRWLTDANAWNADIPQLLREGKVQAVFDLLSGTWTSLGYGIESNLMTPHLEDIYTKLLAEELAGRQATLTR
ncbi:glycoside hydrolase family 24 protein [Parathermosynechococcus lividus]